MSDQPVSQPKRRVLLLTSSSGFFGAERMIITLAGALDRQAFEPVIASLAKKRQSSVEVIEAALSAGFPALAVPCDGRLDWGAVDRIRNLIRDQRIDLIHSQEPKSRLYALLAARGTGVPVVTTHHNWTRQDWRTALVEYVDAAVIRYCRHIAAVSSLAAVSLRSAGVPAKLIGVIPNGIDLSRFIPTPASAELRASLGIPPELTVVGSAGRLDVVKGHDLLLEAARRVRDAGQDAAYLIVGEGVEGVNLERRVRELNMADRIFFAGYQADVARYVALMDIFVLPSRREGTPMALLEAMAMEKAAVATPVGGVPDIIVDGSNGLLLAARSAELLAEALVRLLQDRSLRQRLAAAAGECVRTSFSAAKMARRYEAVYQRFPGKPV